jgi:NhaP-type Na+/H+ or K+/H+ antiporter
VLAAVTATVLMSVIAHGLTARPFAGRYAASIDASPERREHHSVVQTAFRKTLGHHRRGQADAGEPAR